MANRAMGAGTESTENYKNCKRLFMGIDNIHVMRDCHNKLIDNIVLSSPSNSSNSGSSSGGSSSGSSASTGGSSAEQLIDVSGVDKLNQMIDGSNWLKHIRIIMESTLTIVNHILSGSNVLIHCSDGWDRTAQLSSLASIILDPYYRTIKGIQVLVEKEWLSFGHKFSDRLGHFIHHYKGNQKKEQEMAPVFLQFLECVRHIQRQHPEQFEFSERLLVDIYKYAQNCQFGTFCLLNERERLEAKLSTRTQSFWSFINENHDDYLNPFYYYHLSELSDDPIDGSETDDFKRRRKRILNVTAAAKDFSYWTEMYSRHDEDLFGGPIYNNNNNNNFTNSGGYKSVPVSVEAAAFQFAEHLRELEDQVSVLQQSPQSAYTTDTTKVQHWFTPAQPEVSCGICNQLFEVLDLQFRCRLCSTTICSNCSRFKCQLNSTTLNEATISVRVCDKCKASKISLNKL
jgi:hypothetical protein